MFETLLRDILDTCHYMCTPLSNHLHTWTLL